MSEMRHPKEVDRAVCDRVRNVRQILHLRQVDMAKALRISQGAYSNIERYKDNPSKRVLMIISLKFGISEEWLVSGTGTPLSNDEEKANTPMVFMSQFKQEIQQHINAMQEILNSIPTLDTKEKAVATANSNRQGATSNAKKSPKV